jgi:hypothetical protein
MFLYKLSWIPIMMSTRIAVFRSGNRLISLDTCGKMNETLQSDLMTLAPTDSPIMIRASVGSMGSGLPAMVRFATAGAPKLRRSRAATGSLTSGCFFGKGLSLISVVRFNSFGGRRSLATIV